MPDAVGEIRPVAPQDAPSVGPAGEPLPPAIEGVELKQLSSHPDHRGSLTELINLNDPFWREPVVHAYAIEIAPGRIKGWALHRRQADRVFHGGGRVRTVLHDGREGSPTYGAFAEFWFAESRKGLVRIPPGVWHAQQNYGESTATLINFPTVPYDPVDPDKYRIDPTSGEIAFDFTLMDG
jgi:dTDP-4-dehydrorhamnose 3,5-epimerase-like enzyme